MADDAVLAACWASRRTWAGSKLPSSVIHHKISVKFPSFFCASLRQPRPKILLVYYDAVSRLRILLEPKAPLSERPYSLILEPSTL